MTSPWRALDDRLGVPVLFAAAGDRVSTNAAIVASRRGGGAAVLHARRLVGAVRDQLSLNGVTMPDGVVVCDLSHGDEWLARLPSVPSAALARRASSIRTEEPTIRATEGVMAWGRFVTGVGRDSVSWAGLRSASKSAPLVLGLATGVLASRCDENPLALVRRAHAATALRCDEPASPPSVDARLRAAVLAASRALHDVERTGRTRPALLAIEHLAREALRHVERAPVTRTDLPALAVARSILRASLDAVGVSAPVPY